MVNTHWCKGCRYYRPIDNNINTPKENFACHFCYDQGELRGCSPIGCRRREAAKAEKALKQQGKNVKNKLGNCKGGTA